MSILIATAVNTPRILAQSAVPVALAPNGTVATAGTIALGTALPTTYSGGAWVRLPADAIVGGAAGLYWCVFTSTTAGQIYTAFVDPSTAFTPYIPTGLVAAVGSNAAYTQTTGADITLANITVPGGMMGLNGSVRCIFGVTALSNANSKPIQYKLAGNQFVGSTLNAQNSAGINVVRGLTNRGALNKQAVLASSSIGSYGGIGGIYLAVDTAVDQALTMTAQMAVATDWIVLEIMTVEVLPS